MCKETHVFKWKDGKIGHYLDKYNPKMYKCIDTQDWKESGVDLFQWYRETGGFPWILEKIKPLVLENK